MYRWLLAPGTARLKWGYSPSLTQFFNVHIRVPARGALQSRKTFTELQAKVEENTGFSPRLLLVFLAQGISNNLWSMELYPAQSSSDYSCTPCWYLVTFTDGLLVHLSFSSQVYKLITVLHARPRQAQWELPRTTHMHSARHREGPVLAQSNKFLQ